MRRAGTFAARTVSGAGPFLPTTRGTTTGLSSCPWPTRPAPTSWSRPPTGGAAHSQAVYAAPPGYCPGMAASRKEILEIAGREVTITNPDKLYFPEIGLTKLGLVRYYLSVVDGALRGVAGRPMALKRYVNGVDGQAFYQKRAPESRPDWI